MFYSMVFVRKIGVVGAVCLPLALSACAQGINPKPSTPEYQEAIDTDPRITASDYTFDIALAYMDIAKVRMRDYADGPTKTRNLTGAGAVLAAVGAAAAIIFDAHEDLYFGLGLAGGSLLAASNLYGNPAFEQVYENGLSALACVDHKLRPAMVAGGSIMSVIRQADANADAVKEAMEPVLRKHARATSSQPELMELKNTIQSEIDKSRANLKAKVESYNGNASSEKLNELQIAFGEMVAAKVVLEKLKADVEYQETLLREYKAYGDKALNAATELNDKVETVRAAELRMSTDVVGAVDNIFIQVRNRIRDVDPGSQGIANTVALINGFSKIPNDNIDMNNTLDPPDAQNGALSEDQARESIFSNPDLSLSAVQKMIADATGATGLGVGSVYQDAFNEESARLKELNSYKNSRTKIDSIALSGDEISALETAVRALSSSVSKGDRQANSVKEIATQTIDISSCNVEGATILPFELLNKPVVAEGEEPPKTPQFTVEVAKSGETVFTLSVRGGQPNYGYEVLGATPTGVSIMQTRSGAFFIRAAPATTGTLSLHLYDSLKGSESVVLKFVEEGTVGDGGGGVVNLPIVKDPVIALKTDAANPKVETSVSGGKPDYTVIPPDDAPEEVIMVVEKGKAEAKVTITAPKDFQYDGELVYTIKDADDQEVTITLTVGRDV